MHHPPQIDAALASAPPRRRPLVFLLVHCPPEALNLGFPYHAVPVNGWDFAFVDAVSYRDGSVLSPAAAAVAQPAAPIEPRRWVAVAFGLVKRVSAAEARDEYAAVFDEALGQAASGLRTYQRGLNAKALAAAGVAASRATYLEPVGGSQDAKARAAKAALLALFSSRRYLRDVLLDCFIRTCRVALNVRAGG